MASATSMVFYRVLRCIRPNLSGFSVLLPQVYSSSKLCQGCRTLMSATYVNQNTWSQRKKLKADMNELSIQLDRDFYDNKRPVASAELHKFIDNMIDSDDVEIAQGYLYCHRHSIVAHHLKQSTMHSWIRGCLDYKRDDIALKTLQDRTHYGIFPDAYAFNLLLDSYLEKNDYKGAAMVAIEMMNQEVLEEKEPLTQLLALYACHMYMTNGQPAQEETWNLGMTLTDASRGLTSLLGRSYHVIGCAMSGRLDMTLKILKSLESLDEAKLCVVQEAIDKVKTILDSQDQNDEDLTNQIQDTIKSLRSQSKIATDSLDSLIPAQLVNVLPQYEKNHIDGYAEKLEQWHQEYEDAIRKVQESEKEREIASKKARLEELMKEVGGLEYVKQKIEEDLKKREEQQAVTAGETSQTAA